MLVSAYGYSQPGPAIRTRFLEAQPVMDGVLDTNLLFLPSYHLLPDDHAVHHRVAGSIRVAYGTGFLYIYSEVPGDSLVYRDRGYQNGDGMIVVIGRPATDGQPTREFYVLGFTAQPEGTENWQTRFVWYRNVGLQMTRLQNARFKARQGKGLISMECLVPWDEINPYHPWLSGRIGLNVAVVKGAGRNGSTTWFIRNDELIGSEQSPRTITDLFFDPPRLSRATQSYAILSSNHFREGGKASIRLATCFSKPGHETFRIIIYSGEHSRISSWMIDQSVQDTLAVTEHVLPVSGLLAGGYQLEWNAVSGSSKGSLWFTVLPAITAVELRAGLERKKPELSRGSYATIRFMLEDLQSGLDSLKPYETAYAQKTQAMELSKLISAGSDILAKQSGTFRRGFLSAVDSTYRPYSIKVPDSLVAGKRYPMMVFLHGSGQDDRNIIGQLPGYGMDMFILAPNGRGTSNCYTTGHAQEDIDEAVRDAALNYPIDTARIILAGFSMGGYGVYRTFYEHPSRYRCLAVFSGSPNLASKWFGPGHPDFLDEKYLSTFRGVNIFIFHGTDDMNVPAAATRDLVGKLRNAGAVVTYVEEKKGHESPGEGTLSKFREWLGENLSP